MCVVSLSLLLSLKLISISSGKDFLKKKVLTISEVDTDPAQAVKEIRVIMC